MLPQETDLAKKKLLRYVQDARGKFAPRDAIMARLRDLYFLNYFRALPLKVGEVPVVVNKACNVIDLATGILTSNPMSIRAYRIHDDKQDEADSTATEKLLKAVVYMNDERHETDIVNEVTFDQLLGGACIRAVWDDDAEYNEGTSELGTPSRSYDELPIEMDLIPLSNIWYQEGGDRGRFKWVIYHDTRTVEDIEDEWDIELQDYKNQTEKDKIEIEYYDYWGWVQVEETEVPDFIHVQIPEEVVPGLPKKRSWKIQNAILAGNEWVVEPKIVEGYDDIPFTVFPGRLTTSTKPEEHSLSILHPTEDAIKDLAKQLTHYRRIIEIFNAMPMIVEHPVGQEPPEIDLVYGKAVPVVEGTKIYFPQWPGTPPDVKNFMQATEELIQEGSFPQVSYGQAASSSSGYAVSLLSESGRTRLYQFQRSQERGWQTVFRKILHLVETFGRGVEIPVYGREGADPYMFSTTGDKVAGFRVDVQIKPRFPQDESRDVAMATQIKAQKLLSTNTIQQRYLNVDHPDDERERQLVEMALENPELMKMKMAEALQQWSGESIPMQPQTMQQNMAEQAMAGKRPQPMPPQAPMLPAAVMPPDMAGQGPPQTFGQEPPSNMLPPDLLRALQGARRF